MKRGFVDTNVDAILPGQKGPGRAQPPQEALPETRTDRKKRAQLERYVEKKLKKDGRADLFARLQRSAPPSAASAGGHSETHTMQSTLHRHRKATLARCLRLLTR